MIYVVVCLLKIMGLVVARYVLFGFVLPEYILILGRGGYWLSSFVSTLVDPWNVTFVRDCYLSVSFLKLCCFNCVLAL